jgi:hypothetical protein
MNGQQVFDTLSVWRRRATYGPGKWLKGGSRALILFLIFLNVAAPPGLCPCWLHPQVETVHLHFSKEHAESEHSHDYLFHLSQTTGVDFYRLAILPDHLLVAIAFAGLIWWVLKENYFPMTGWTPNVLREPPENG